jgi:multidrug efflux pump subunit AcrA (membrane-fusion protein)
MRIAADVPEEDFEAVVVGAPVTVHLLATRRDLVAKISRRAPAADPATRTAHIELDVDDPERAIPAWTTAELSLDVGSPISGSAIPLAAASIHAGKATVFVAKDGVAHQVIAKTIGERGGTLYLDPAALAAGTAIVTEGRTVLSDGDAIAPTPESWTPDQVVKK